MARRVQKALSGGEPLPDSLEPLEIALDAERRDPAADSPARRLLLAQIALIGDDRRHRRLQIHSERFGAVLKLMTGVAGLVLAALLGAMIWNAAHDRSLVIAAFRSPPEMTARGLSGDVLAAQVMDRLGAIDADATSFRAPQTFQGDWGGDIKVEIPQTGVSISELDRYLRSLLSHRTTIGGEVFRRPDGLITLSVRTGSIRSHSFTGPEADLDKLLQQAAEAVFEDTQPFRYSKYLERTGQTDKAMAVARKLAETGPASEKPWAWAQISNLLELSDMPGAAEAGRISVRLDPNQGLGYLNLSIAEALLGHDEASYQAGIRSVDILRRGGGGLSETGIKIGQSNDAGSKAVVGDYQGALAVTRRRAADDIDYMDVNRFQPVNEALGLLGLHEVTAARGALGAMDDETAAAILLFAGGDVAPQFNIAMEQHDWAAAERYARLSLAVLRKQNNYLSGLTERNFVRPRLALTVALQGRIEEARGLIADAPADCYRCQIQRGQIAGLAGDRAGAARFFADAARQAPSLPWAHLEWARMLLAAGDNDGALVQLAVAQARAPRFADVREMKGEALLARGDAKGAIGEFSAAQTFAPKWGRNQLMWGRALAALGRTDEAQAKWRAALALDLIPADRALAGRLLKGGR